MRKVWVQLQKWSKSTGDDIVKRVDLSQGQNGQTRFRLITEGPHGDYTFRLACKEEGNLPQEGAARNHCGQVQPWSRLRRRQPGIEHEKSSKRNIEVEDEERNRRTDAGAQTNENEERSGKKLQELTKAKERSWAASTAASRKVLEQLHIRNSSWAAPCENEIGTAEGKEMP